MYSICSPLTPTAVQLFCRPPVPSFVPVWISPLWLRLVGRAGSVYSPLSLSGGMMMDKKVDVGRRAHRVGVFIDEFQRYFTSIERCARPVVAAVSGGCIRRWTQSAHGYRRALCQCRCVLFA